MTAVDNRQDARFLADRLFLDDELTAGGAELVAADDRSTAAGLLRLSHDHALPAAGRRLTTQGRPRGQ
jgi:hypothetical protein